MKSLKEKFGKFEMSKEQVKAVKGGESEMTTDNYFCGGNYCFNILSGEHWLVMGAPRDRQSICCNPIKV